VHQVAAPIVQAEDVIMAYPGEGGQSIVAVEAATFDVLAGEKFVIIGPSGCGKTTLLKAVAGFMQPAAGRITVGGKPLEKPGPDRAVVFQDFDQLFPWRTVRDNVVYALRVAKKMNKRVAGARADEVLALVDIARAADRYPHQLSGGMKQRAAIARAVALEPTILLMDEPFGALDAITRNQLQIELNRIWERTGVTLILVTHSIQEAIYLGHRVMVMSKFPARVREIVDTSGVDDPSDDRFAELTGHLRSLLVPAISERAPLAAGIE
jgi:NitT/TauT family transport system ATP-binding protein